MARILSFLYAAYFFGTSVLLFCVSLVLLPWTLLFDPNRRLLHLVASAWGFHFVMLNPLWKCKFEGIGNLRQGQAYVIVANHQSIADTFVLSGLFFPFKWVAKDSLFRLPFFGWNMFLTKYVPIERGGLSSIKNMMAACREWLRRGESVLLFPEGTRSDDGRLGKFRDGSFKLSTLSNRPILPVVIEGTRDIVPKHGMQLKFSANVTVRVLPAVFPAEFDYDTSKLRDYVHRTMESTLAQTAGQTLRCC